MKNKIFLMMWLFLLITSATAYAQSGSIGLTKVFVLSSSKHADALPDTIRITKHSNEAILSNNSQKKFIVDPVAIVKKDTLLIRYWSDSTKWDTCKIQINLDKKTLKGKGVWRQQTGELLRTENFKVEYGFVPLECSNHNPAHLAKTEKEATDLANHGCTGFHMASN